MRNVICVFILLLLAGIVFMLCCIPYQTEKFDLVLWMSVGAAVGIVAAAGAEGLIRRRKGG